MFRRPLTTRIFPDFLLIVADKIRKERKNLIASVVIIIVTAAVFYPSLLNGFIDWDDPAYVTENDLIKALSWQNLRLIFTTGVANLYSPLAVVSNAVEYRFFDLRPFFYHLNNYLLHIAATLLVFWFINGITGKTTLSFITAILFGVHPLHVESVAWISERKDVLCALFYIFSLILYERYLLRRTALRYLLCLALVTLSLLSKPMAVSLPVIFIVLDRFHGRRMEKSLFPEKVPFFALAFVTALINFQFRDRSTGLVFTGALQRIYYLLKPIPFYLSKVFVPLNLSAFYPFGTISRGHIGEITGYALIMTALVFIFVLSLQRSREIALGGLFFILSIAPVLQIIPTGNVFAADRYMYLPSIGIFFIVAVFLERTLTGNDSRSKSVRGAVMLLFFVWLIMLSITSWKRCAVWKDSLTFYRETLPFAEESPVIHNNLGLVYARLNRLDEAITQYLRAIELNPNNKKAYNNLGSAYYSMGKIREAIESYEKLVSIDPHFAEAYYNLGIIYFNTGKTREAIASYKKAIQVNPRSADAYYNLGNAYYSLGNITDAIESFKRIIEIEPGYVKAYNNLGGMYMSMDMKTDALNIYKKALEIDPRNINAYNGLGVVYASMGRKKEARQLLEKAIALSPDSGAIHFNLAVLYNDEGRYDLAIEHCDKAIELGAQVDPEYLELLKPHRQKRPE